MRAYRLKEVADILGTCRQTIYRRVEQGEIPCNKSLGPKLWRIPGEWVAQYINTQPHTSADTTFRQQPAATKSNELRRAQRGKQGILKP